LLSRLDAFEKAQERTERAVREKMAQSRDEQGKAAKDQRQELTEAFKISGGSVVQRMMDAASIQKGQFDAFSGQLTSFAKASGERLDGIRAESATGDKQLREEVMVTLKNISERIAKTMKDLVVAKQLDQMRQTVDEKLQGTLKKRLGESFKQVSKRLEQMHKEFGEMQTLPRALAASRRCLQMSRRVEHGVKCSLVRYWSEC